MDDDRLQIRFKPTTSLAEYYVSLPRRGQIEWEKTATPAEKQLLTLQLRYDGLMKNCGHQIKKIPDFPKSKNNLLLLLEDV